MADSQQFSLRWNNYLRHITCAFDSLRNDEDLVDVTLSCEGKKIRAHKMLLSACSTYFRDLFKENPCQHPVIIFRNVRFDDLSALVDFMYQGEVNVLQEQLASFLTTAELLAVQGLSDGYGSDAHIETRECEPPPVPVHREPGIARTLLKQLSANQSDSPVSLFPVAPASKRRKRADSAESRKRTSAIKVEAPEYDDQDGSSNSYEDSNQLAQLLSHDASSDHDLQFTDTTEHLSEDSISATDTNPLSQPGTSADNTTQDSLQVGSHRRNVGVPKIPLRFECSKCNKVFNHLSSLNKHKQVHSGRTTCPVCFKVLNRTIALQKHMAARHGPLKHELRACDTK